MQGECIDGGIQEFVESDTKLHIGHPLSNKGLAIEWDFEKGSFSACKASGGLFKKEER